jgi:hypothetical protein
MFTFGKQIEGDSRLWWGARAIFKGCSDNYLIDLLRDRQSSKGFEDSDVSEQDRQAFMNWLNKRALPWLRTEVKRRHLSTDIAEEIVFQEWKYELRANTNASYGYLYIGAVEHNVEEIAPEPNKVTGAMERILKVAEQTYVWGRKYDPPLIGTEGNVRVNGIGKGTVVGYQSENYGDSGHQLLNLRVKLYNPPKWWVDQTTNDCIRKAVKIGELQAKRGTDPENGVASPSALKEWKKNFELPPCIVWDGDFQLLNEAPCGSSSVY